LGFSAAVKLIFLVVAVVVTD